MMTSHRSARSVQGGIVTSRSFYYAYGTQGRDATLPTCCRMTSPRVRPSVELRDALQTTGSSWQRQLHPARIIPSIPFWACTPDIDDGHMLPSIRSMLVLRRLLRITYILTLTCSPCAQTPYDPPWPRLTSASDIFS